MSSSTASTTTASSSTAKAKASSLFRRRATKESPSDAKNFTSLAAAAPVPLCTGRKAASPFGIADVSPVAAPADEVSLTTREGNSLPSSPTMSDGGIGVAERPFTSPNLLPNSFSRQDLKPKGWDRLVIHPDSKIKSYYEMLIVVCVLYTAIIEPYEITYMFDIAKWVDVRCAPHVPTPMRQPPARVPPDGRLARLARGAQDVLDGVFIVDVLVQFVSGFHDSGGKRFPVLNLKTVARTYFLTWFPIDLIAAIPFDRFMPEDVQDTSVAIRIPGLFKCVRLLKLRRTTRKWNGTTYGPILKVVVIVGCWLLLAHWFACGWFLLGWYTCPTYANNLASNGPWITQYWPALIPNCTAVPHRRASNPRRPRTQRRRPTVLSGAAPRRVLRRRAWARAGHAAAARVL